MKYLFSVIPVLLFLSSFGQANLNVQTDEIGQVSDMENLLRTLSYTTNNELNLETIEGSAYLSEDFSEGDVFLSSGVKYTNIPLRYNVYNDQIEFRSTKGQIFNINNPESLAEVSFNGFVFRYVVCEINKQSKKVFAQVIADGNAKLLKRHRMKLQPGTPAQTHKEAQPPKFIKTASTIFVQKGEEIAQPIKNEKDLLTIFSDKDNDLKAFIEKENLSVKSEDDLIKIVNYYNSL